MILLNLETHNKQEEIVKNYLQENASEILANKINNGVEITKDNKTLISKKTLKGFMNYACEEARKQAENGASSAMIEDSVVFGWAIHYFEEDSIPGDLFNLDGTPYEPPKPVYKPSTTSIPKAIKKEERQPSLFDMIEQANSKKEEPDSTDDNNEEWTEDEIKSAMEEMVEEESKEKSDIDTICERIDNAISEKNKENISPLYSKYKELEEKYPDSIIAYRVGDFYEIFGDNAKIVANEVDLTLTGRDFGLSERIPMVGFPYHVAEQYISKIVSFGHQIAVVEKDNEYIKSPSAKVDMITGEIIQDQNEFVDILKQQLGNTFEVKL